MHSDEYYMHRCLQLAIIGKGKVAPNPMVGAVIVHENKIIGEGYHEVLGGSHAEVNAINNVPKSSAHLISNATIYVSLEPCSHHGKTPPCANLLIEKQFKRVVVGMKDPHEKVAGKGINLLRSNGIQVEIGILEKECQKINKHFISFHSKNRPYVLIKWAQTTNGLIDSGETNGKINWISSKNTKAWTHTLRNEYQAILVGRKTIENDNPSLTTRSIEGSNPIRIIIDPNLKLPTHHTVFNSEAQTIVINSMKSMVTDNLHYIQLESITPQSIIDCLYKQSIQSVLIEGGRQTIQSFIDSELWDEIKVIQGETTYPEGTLAPNINQSPDTIESFFTDTIFSYSHK